MHQYKLVIEAKHKDKTTKKRATETEKWRTYNGKHKKANISPGSQNPGDAPELRRGGAHPAAGIPGVQPPEPARLRKPAVQ